MPNFIDYPHTENELLTDFHNAWSGIFHILEKHDSDFFRNLPLRADIKNTFLLYFPPGDHPVFWLASAESIKRMLCAASLQDLVTATDETLNILKEADNLG